MPTPEAHPLPEQPSSVTRAYAFVTPRGLYWRVRLTADGIRLPVWRMVSREDFPTPEQAAKRAARHLPQPVRLAFQSLLWPAEDNHVAPGRCSSVM